MSTYKILKNVLDFLEEKNELCKRNKLPDDEEIEVDRSSMQWNKVYPKVESPQSDDKEEKKTKLERDIKDIVKVTIDRYYDSDRSSWYRYVEIETCSKGKGVDCTIPLRWYNRWHPQVLRAKRLFIRMEIDITTHEMYEIDKNMALIDPRRIDEILQGDNDGKEEVHEGET